MAKAPATPNWGRLGSVWLPIDSLADSWSGPVVLADETQTIQWFAAKASKAPVKNVEHQRDEAGDFKFKLNSKSEQEPVTVERDVAPAYWSPAVVVEA